MRRCLEGSLLAMPEGQKKANPPVAAGPFFSSVQEAADYSSTGEN